MSGIVGLFNLDGQPVDPALPARMLRTIGYRGSDRSRVWQEGPVALGHCLLATTPESVGENQPLHLAGQGLCIAFDGRIDNREELLESFDRERISPAASSDAAFALAAYQCWGEDCGARLLGDFAFAIWDVRRRQVFCVRDVVGVKPFYYHCGRNVFLFASEPQALLVHPAVSRRPNEGMVGEYLSVVTSLEDTLFADIQRLPPASQLVVAAGRHRVDQYWEIDAARDIRYRTVGEYGEHLRSLLREAVRVRMRSCSTVGVMLSGGVDSSSLVAMATSLKRDGAVTAGCEAWSLVAPGDVLDESYYIDQVVTLNACRAHKVAGDVPLSAQYRRAARSRADVPPAPNGRLACTLKTRAREAGTTVLLSGLWGDEWFSGSSDSCADLFRSMQWSTLLGQLRGQPGFPRSLPMSAVKSIAWPLLPRSVRKRIKMLIGRDGIPPWIPRDFSRRVALADRLYPVAHEPAFPTAAQRAIYREATSGVGTLATEEEDRTAAEFGVETRHPFADRRVMEFGMGIPEDLRLRDGVKKFVLRDAMRAHLPDEVGGRLTSADASAVFLDPLRELVGGGLLRSPAIARQGWVDAGEVRRLYDNMVQRYESGDSTYAVNVWPVWMIAATEMWMQDVVEAPATEEDRWEKMLTNA